MKNILSIILTLILTESAIAATFDVGGKQLDIPPPQGFSQVTEQMGPVYRLCQQMVDPMNDTLAYYIAESDVPVAMAGKVPPLDRYFTLKVIKDEDLKRRLASAKDFAGLKDMIRRKNKEFLKSVESKLPGAMEQTSKGVSKELNVDFALQVSQMVLLDPHYETDNALAYSMYARVQTSTEGAKTDQVVSGTTTFLNAAGKIVYLYCYAPQKDLAWTRDASKTWANAVTAANAPPPARSSGGTGIAWEKVIPKIFVGAIFGCIGAVLLGTVFKLRKKKG